MKSDETSMRITGEGIDTGWVDVRRLEQAAARVSGRAYEQLEIPGAAEQQPPTEDERIEIEDELFRELLTAEQLVWQNDVRTKHLRAEGAIVETARRSRQTKLKLGVIFRHSQEQMSCSAKLTVTFTARARQISDVALSRYLSELATYEGLPSDVADQVCHDLYVELRPKTIKVQLVATIHGVERTEEEERSWM